MVIDKRMVAYVVVVDEGMDEGTVVRVMVVDDVVVVYVVVVDERLCM